MKVISDSYPYTDFDGGVSQHAGARGARQRPLLLRESRIRPLAKRVTHATLIHPCGCRAPSLTTVVARQVRFSHSSQLAKEGGVKLISGSYPYTDFDAGSAGAAQHEGTWPASSRLKPAPFVPARPLTTHDFYQEWMGLLSLADSDGGAAGAAQHASTRGPAPAG